MQVTAVVAVVLCALAATVSSAQVLSTNVYVMHVFCHSPRCFARVSPPLLERFKLTGVDFRHCRLRT